MLVNKLNYGDTIGVVGVSNSLEVGAGYDCFYKAEQFFISKGFKIKRGKYVLNDYYNSAGTKEQRAQDLMDMFKDDEVKLIFCLKGGETCNTFIDLLDYEEIKKHPKIITGYSDITVLLNAIYKKTGMITYHGSDFVDFGKKEAEERFIEFENTFINKKLDRLLNSEKKVVRNGQAKGKIIGTNLALMNLIGTEYLPDMQDKILFMESYRTSPNECHRRFAHLKQCGIFDKVKGIVVGYVYDLQKNGDIYPQMEDILLEYTKEYDFPIIKCNSFGHKIVNATIPIGVKIKIDNDKFEIIEDFLLD